MDPTSPSFLSALTGPFAPIPSYVNPQFVSPAQIAALRAAGVAQSQQMQVHRPSEGIANIVRALVGGNEEFQADQLQQAATKFAGDQASTMYGAGLGNGAGGGLPPTAAPLPNSPTAGPTTGQGGNAALAQPAADLSPGFNSAVNRTLGFEGGLNPRDTNGTPTNFGINQAANPGVNVGALTPDQAKGLYKQRYWDTIGADNMSPALARVAFDTSVLAGPGRANQMVAQAGNDPNKLLQIREQYLNNLATSDPQKYGPYVSAWNARNAGLAADVAAMTQGQNGAGAPQSPPSAVPPQPPSGMSAQDYGRIQANQFLPEQTKEVASRLISPSIIQDPLGTNYRYTPMAGTAAAPVTPGARVDTVQVGGQSLPIMTYGTAGNPTTRVLTPNTPEGAGPGGGGPLAPYQPYIEQGQQIQAAGAANQQAGLSAGQQWAQEHQASGNYARTVFPLMHAIPALEALGKTGTGPGTEQRNEILSFLQSVGVPGIDPSKIQSFDEAKKYLVDFVNQSGASGTNDKLAAAFSGNPSVHISNAASVDVAKSALALQRMQQAKVLAFQNSGQSPVNYPSFASNFSSTMDPRAFGIDLMSPQARAQLAQSMPQGSPERARFNESLKAALGSGLIPQQ